MNGYGEREQPKRMPSIMPATLAVALWLIVPGIAMAQATTSPMPGSDESVDNVDTAEPSSTETGQSPLDESFAPRTHDDWVRQARRKAWKDTTFDVQIRTFYLDRHAFDDSQNEAWTLGGSVGFQTGYFRDRFSLGATGYTSQRLYGPLHKDGTLLLAPGQHGYSVLGELYGEFLLDQDTKLSVGRRGIDTPYLNRNDTRMTPNTFESITLLGLYGGGEGESEWRGGVGYFNEIKVRNSDQFESMASASGAPDGIERGVYVGGGNYTKGAFSIGAIDYYSDDIINIFYAETKIGLPLNDDWRLRFALQLTNQQSAGEHLLRGEDFSVNQWGGKAELAGGGALFSAAYTRVDGDIDVQSAWGAYPGYTGVQVEDFNRAGEEAWMLRAAYNFPSPSGLSVYGMWVNGSNPDHPGNYAKDEVDINLQWTPDSGQLKGLMVRLRYAHVSQHDPEHSDLDDLRLMIYFDPPSF